MQDWLDSNTLFASLLWSSVGLGFCIYGKRQREWIPLASGVGVIAVSYLVASWLWMSLLSAAILLVGWILHRQQA